MAITIDELQFDPTAVDDNQKVGSYIISSSGDVIDSTDVGGTEGLNVNVLNDLNVDADGVYDAGSNANPDNIGIISHTRNASPGDAQQVERTTAAQPGNVADDSLVNALDVNSFAMGLNGTTWEGIPLSDDGVKVDISTVNDDDADAGGSLKVGQRGLSTAAAIGALSAANDRADMVSDLYRRLMVRDSFDVGWAISTVAATATAAEVAGTPLGGRKMLHVQNLGSNDVWIGPDNTVTISTGTKIPKNGSAEFRLGEALNMFAICDTGKTADLRVSEYA